MAEKVDGAPVLAVEGGRITARPDCFLERQSNGSQRV
uniref:Uncharacterized protein n=1 Tax=Rhizophora mucronata TaxID=61149 RepID=A0A2P2P3K1_RHIMU